LWEAVENALEQRAISLSGDPVYGLLLHNGAVYADAQVFGRHAIELFTLGRLRRDRARQRLEFAARTKAVLVEVLTALVVAEKPPSYPARRAILRQIEDLQLPFHIARDLRRHVRRTFEKGPLLDRLLRSVRSRDVRRFILEQTLLASLVDGRRSRAEVAFIHTLGAKLGFDAQAISGLELGVAEFYAANRDLVDVFTVSDAASVMGEELVESMRASLEKNFHRLVREVRETGELSVLLTKMARGQALTGEEKDKVRKQLLDVAKAIPALAIFAAPGGLFLLAALAKVLPFSLLPSSFSEDEETNPGTLLPKRRQG
jgi:hypothetical protein